MLAEAKGIEPLSTGLEPVILPLYYTPILQHARLISTIEKDKNFAVGVLKITIHNYDYDYSKNLVISFAVRVFLILILYLKFYVLSIFGVECALMYALNNYTC